jgi:dephospho-CoA kinase
MVKAKNIVICITGTMTSGKAALQYFLVNRGFKAIRNTTPILEEGLKRKLDMSNRQNWIDLLVEMRKKKGLEVLAKQSAKEIKLDERYVICPIRHPADIKFFKKNYHALIIFIDAPFETRYKRTLLKELGSKLTINEFRLKDDLENNPTVNDKKYLPNVGECKKLADEIINNDKSLNDLNEKLEKILRKNKIPDMEDTGVFEDFDM